MLFFWLFMLGLWLFPSVQSLPDQGEWNINFTETDRYVGVYKSLYSSSEVYVRFNCSVPDLTLKVGWVIRTTPCWNEYQHLNQQGDAGSNLSIYYNSPETVHMRGEYNRCWYQRFDETTVACSDSLLPLLRTNRRFLDEVKPTADKNSSIQHTRGRRTLPIGKWQYLTIVDAIYLLVVHVEVVKPPPDGSSVNVHIVIKSRNSGYLSVADWPNLPFYAVMTVVYLVYLLFWMIVCCMRWRELLRIQYWIGAVILTGFIEKAAFLAEYDAVNRTGVSMYGSVIFAEIVSCMKRAMARILVVIVSVGFGITKPRLGPLLHRVLLVGIVYFVFALIESCSRTLRPRKQLSSDVMISSVIVAVMDSAICWWMFTSLVNTTRTLRLRRNEVKLSLYRHFTNTLIFCVIASVAFMAWSMHFHKAWCLREWRNIWTDEACWHSLFSIILAVIMILWRPATNNQRYAFTPLLDVGDDDDEEDELFRPESFHDVRMRVRSDSAGSREQRHPLRQNSDDDLKWVEDNIPASMAETALPVMDSDEEVMNAKFEISKMQ